MEQISSHTLNENNTSEEEFFGAFLSLVTKPVPYQKIYPSFEQVNFVAEEALKYFEKLEDFGACQAIKRYIGIYVNMIPKTSAEAVKFLVETVDYYDTNFVLNMEAFSLAVKLHNSTGQRIIDLWLLRHEKSPLVKYFKKEQDLTDPDRIAHRILVSYATALQAQVEAGTKTAYTGVKKTF